MRRRKAEEQERARLVAERALAEERAREQAEADDAALIARVAELEAAATTPEGILAASNVASLAEEDEAQNNEMVYLLNKVRLRLSDYE